MTRIFSLLLLFIAAMPALSQDEFTRTGLGKAVPAFSFEVKPGETHQIADYKGKVVLITFWANWCPPCRKELPFINSEIWAKYKNNKQFAFLGFGREHDWATVNKFRKEQKFEMPLLPDPGRKIFDLFAGQNIPRNFLVGKDGKIIYSSIGFNEEDFAKLKKEIEKALL